MFRAILYTQWRWSRLVILVGAVAAFALPILSVERPAAGESGQWMVRQLLGEMEQWSVLYPVLATTLALLSAGIAWGPDHRGRHVYALSLPLPRWHYALLRFGAGATLLAVPIVALWTGALLAVSLTDVPAGVHAYPTALAVRFALAVGVAYTVFFSVSAGTTRTAAWILGVIAALVVVQVLAQVAGLNFSPIELLMNRVLVWPGPLEIFSGRWMLIDV